MSEREKLQSLLRERIGRLEGRLSPILGPAAPDNRKLNGETAAPRPSNHAQNIEIANQDLEQLLHWLEQIEERLEL